MIGQRGLFLFVLTFPPGSGLALPRGLAGVERGVDTGVDTTDNKQSTFMLNIHLGMIIFHILNNNLLADQLMKELMCHHPFPYNINSQHNNFNPP